MDKTLDTPIPFALTEAVDALLLDPPPPVDWNHVTPDPRLELLDEASDADVELLDDDGVWIEMPRPRALAGAR